MMKSGIQEGQMRQKGQVAFEFLVIYSLFIFLFLAAMWAISQKAMYSQFYAEQIFAREAAARFADEINIAARFPGYAKTYYFPSTLKGAAYDLQVRNGTLVLNYTANTEIVFFYPLSTRSIYVVYDPVMGRINTARGSMTIQNDLSTGQIIIG
jgi:hypothetical protein